MWLWKFSHSQRNKLCIINLNFLLFHLALRTYLFNLFTRECSCWKCLGSQAWWFMPVSMQGWSTIIAGSVMLACLPTKFKSAWVGVILCLKKKEREWGWDQVNKTLLFCDLCLKEMNHFFLKWELRFNLFVFSVLFVAHFLMYNMLEGK